MTKQFTLSRANPTDSRMMETVYWEPMLIEIFFLFRTMKRATGLQRNL